MDNSFITSKYAIIFEGKDYAGSTKTYSVKIGVDFAEYMPIWDVDSEKANPLFYNKPFAEEFVNKIKTSDKPHITNFIKKWGMDIDSLRVLELGFNDECNFEVVLLNVD